MVHFPYPREGDSCSTGTKKGDLGKQSLPCNATILGVGEKVAVWPCKMGGFCFWVSRLFWKDAQ